MAIRMLSCLLMMIQKEMMIMNNINKSEISASMRPVSHGKNEKKM